MRQAQAVKKGVASAGGTPREFCTITVTDGIAMGHQGMKSSLPSREVIADSIELTMRGHCYDALIGVAGCDKSLPGMMMAMCRLNVPSIFIYGGSILPGSFRGKPVTVQDLFEAVGKVAVGDMSLEDIRDGIAEGRIHVVSTEDGEDSGWNPFDTAVDDDRVAANTDAEAEERRPGGDADAARD